MEHKIDYDTILANLTKMINTLEYDSMRSAGKAKMNSQHLHSMIYLRNEYKKMVKPAHKEG